MCADARRSGCRCHLPYAPWRQLVHYLILRRLNTGTFAKSRTIAKTIAAARTLSTVEAGKGAIAIPPIASVEAIRRSPIDEATTQPPGRDDHRCRRSRLVEGVARLAKTSA